MVWHFKVRKAIHMEMIKQINIVWACLTIRHSKDFEQISGPCWVPFYHTFVYVKPYLSVMIAPFLKEILYLNSFLAVRGKAKGFPELFVL